jgi:hypothetical protein
MTTVEDLIGILRRYSPAESITITVMRADGEQDLQVVLGER